ncbi:hypothetical protein RRG08_063375 [Elysia crispata]|uniref:Uncharacterized protein n=1 Tax=Elysia crispata TaxID=231223 RepID=A0AAE1B2W5_9GAST|nr:hypothetical protein RRG08_063375 [Elysia crispata]
MDRISQGNNFVLSMLVIQMMQTKADSRGMTREDSIVLGIEWLASNFKGMCVKPDTKHATYCQVLTGYSIILAGRADQGNGKGLSTKFLNRAEYVWSPYSVPGRSSSSS